MPGGLGDRTWRSAAALRGVGRSRGELDETNYTRILEI